MNNNLSQEKMNNIKKLVDSGNINEAISQISPEMIENFSKMMNNNSKNSKSSNSSKDSNSTYSNNNFDFGNIDMNTFLKIKSAMDKMNNTNDPRSNLLHSLKPYLRENKQEKLDQYVNLLYFSKVAELFNNTNNKKDD
ncbi:MAG: hypothetical protein IKF97_01770 [Clostridia bacterium]|nr:hypothetical protein [Clostridia bacterium]